MSVKMQITAAVIKEPSLKEIYSFYWLAISSYDNLLIVTATTLTIVIATIGLSKQTMNDILIYTQSNLLSVK
ncbi:hypothetical protein PDN41_21440 [Bacillus cereus]|nr:hypothetical protein [Bacillus cereus]